MSPEAKARLIIDAKLSAAGWRVQDLKQINLGAAVGVAVREYPTDTGPADYVLFVNREPVGVIEAKADEIILTFVEYQTERYAKSLLKWRGFFYQQSYQRRPLTFEMIEKLHDARSRPPLMMLTTGRLWSGEQTIFEAELCPQLRAKRFSNFKFIRQQPVGPYIVAFVCFHGCLIIEHLEAALASFRDVAAGLVSP